MKIKRYTAVSMRAALAQVRAEQGPDAVILSSRRGDDGIEVIAAIDYDEALFAEANRQRMVPIVATQPEVAPVMPIAPIAPAAPVAHVPAVTLTLDASDYFDLHHTPDDTLDKIVPARINQTTAAYAVFTYLAAELDGDYRATPKQPK